MPNERNTEDSSFGKKGPLIWLPAFMASTRYTYGVEPNSGIPKKQYFGRIWQKSSLRNPSGDSVHICQHDDIPSGCVLYSSHVHLFVLHSKHSAQTNEYGMGQSSWVVVCEKEAQSDN